MQGEGGGLSTRYQRVFHSVINNPGWGVMQWVVLCSNLVLASLSVWAAIMASSHLKALRRKLAERSSRSLRELDSAVASLESALSSNTTTLRRLSSRIGMQDVRERRKQASATQMPLHLSPAERKAWIRRELQKGNLQVIRDGVPSPGGESPDS